MSNLPETTQSVPAQAAATTSQDVTVEREGQAARLLRYRVLGGQPGEVSLVTTVRDWLRKNFSFWLALPIMAMLSFGYFYLIAERHYVSTSVISLKTNSSGGGGGLASFLGGIANIGGSGTQDATLAAFIQSPDMLAKLDKQFGLRAVYSSPQRAFFFRMSASAGSEKFLSYYQSLIEVDVRHDVSILTLSVRDYDPTRAQRLNNAIIGESEKFMNAVSRSIQEETVKFARAELNAAMIAVAKASPAERAYAEQRLNTATQGLATASGMASQQAIYIIRISNPNYPTEATEPARFLNSIAVLLIFSAMYVIGSLIWANIVDHRRI